MRPSIVKFDAYEFNLLTVSKRFCYKNHPISEMFKLGVGKRKLYLLDTFKFSVCMFKVFNPTLPDFTPVQAGQAIQKSLLPFPLRAFSFAAWKCVRLGHLFAQKALPCHFELRNEWGLEPWRWKYSTAGRCLTNAPLFFYFQDSNPFSFEESAAFPFLHALERVKLKKRA